ADAALVVEVSASSREKDERVKLPIYAAAGIEEFWIADLARDAIVVHRQPKGGAYADVREIAGDERIEPLAAPGFAVSPAELLA
ncbi:MAG: Uma2 family endonuclease, partial [Planctomycetales bacterium]|nr:Uma2 family endonuclease [Planctomycetales bacterium]